MRSAVLALTLCVASAPAYALDREVRPGQSIQQALNEVARAGGGTVMVREGRYTETLRLSGASNVNLVSMDGPGKAHVMSGGTAIYFHGGSNNQIRGMGVTAGGNGIQVGGSTGGYAKDYVVDGNVVFNAGLDGIKVHQGSGFEVSNNLIQNAGTTPGNRNRDVAVDFVATLNSEFSDNTVLRSNGDTCVMVKGGTTGMIFEGNDLSGCKNGFHVGGFTDDQFMAPGSDGREAYNNLFTDNEINSSGCAFSLFDGERRRMDNRIENNGTTDGSRYCVGDGTGSASPGGNTGGGGGDGGSTGNEMLDELVAAFQRGASGPGAVSCSSTAMEAVMAAGTAVSGYFSGGRATVIAQFAQQLQLIQANYCSGVTNDHLHASNRNEVVMIDYYIAMLKGTDWKDQNAAVAGTQDLAAVLRSGGRILSPSAVPADYEAAYPMAYAEDSEKLGESARQMADRQRRSQVLAQQQQAAGVKSIGDMPGRISRIMASAKAAPGWTGVGQERIKTRALLVEAITAKHASLLAAEQAKLNAKAQEQQNRALAKQAFENAMKGWGECARCAR